jgi:hypothetical protein
MDQTHAHSDQASWKARPLRETGGKRCIFGAIRRSALFAKRRFAPMSCNEEVLRASRRSASAVPETHLSPRCLEKRHRQGCAIRNVIDIVGRMKSCFVIF